MRMFQGIHLDCCAEKKMIKAGGKSGLKDNGHTHGCQKRGKWYWGDQLHSNWEMFGFGEEGLLSKYAVKMMKTDVFSNVIGEIPKSTKTKQ